VILGIPDSFATAVLDMSTTMTTLEAAAKAAVAGRVVHAERSNLMLPNGWMRMAPAALVDEGIVGYKEFHLAEGTGIRFTIWLFDLPTGQPLAMVDGKHITMMRTGASGGLGIKYLAPQSAATAAVIGSSETAFRQLEAAAVARTVTSAAVYSPTEANRLAFARRASDELGIRVAAVDDPREAVVDARILIISTDTRGRGPAVGADLVQPGMHINSIGSTLWSQRELHHSVWPHVDVVAVDTLGVLHDSGDIMAAREHDVFDESRVVPIDQVIAGAAPGRRDADQTTLYKSVGTSAQDVAAALVVYRAAVERGEGAQLLDIVEVRRD
jgi:alanine dehydrogenase